MSAEQINYQPTPGGRNYAEGDLVESKTRKSQSELLRKIAKTGAICGFAFLVGYGFDEIFKDELSPKPLGLGGQCPTVTISELSAEGISEESIRNWEIVREARMGEEVRLTNVWYSSVSKAVDGSNQSYYVNISIPSGGKEAINVALVAISKELYDQFISDPNRYETDYKGRVLAKSDDCRFVILVGSDEMSLVQSLDLGKVLKDASGIEKKLQGVEIFK